MNGCTGSVLTASNITAGLPSLIVHSFLSQRPTSGAVPCALLPKPHGSREPRRLRILRVGRLLPVRIHRTDRLPAWILLRSRQVFQKFRKRRSQRRLTSSSSFPVSKPRFLNLLPSLNRRPLSPGTSPPLPPARASFQTQTGVSEPEPCPLGTYGNTTGLRKITDCKECDPGSYCDQRGLTNPAGPCDPGYYCLDGSYTSAPNAPGSPLSIEDTDIGGLCPGGLRSCEALGVRAE